MNLPKELPFLPGMTFDDPNKTNFKKTQQFGVSSNTMLEKTNFLKNPIDKNLLDSIKIGTAININNVNQDKEEAENLKLLKENDSIPKIQPNWLKYDRKVLRFFGYFKENIDESRIENYRIRNLIIYYYLEDDTILVIEPKQENSGITQGQFLKRQKILKNLKVSSEFYVWKDFNLSINIEFYGLIVRIYDCDLFTKTFLEENGIKLNQKEELKDDDFKVMMNTKNIIALPMDYLEIKEYNEVKLGGGHPNKKLEKYLNNDRKVLNFKILWVDESLCGGHNFYYLNFFLADDTVEVKEINTINNGKDQFPLLLNRSKLPKKFNSSNIYPGMKIEKEQFYQWIDFKIGNYINVFNRNCLIISCNDFTKRFFKDNLNYDQIDLKLENNNKYNNTKNIIIPPYNGFGTEEDSLGNCFSLQQKPPKKDLKKMFQMDGLILRFKARLISLNKDDNNKMFIISYFCGDNSIQIFLKTERNSGIIPGKYLEKMRYKNPVTNNYFQQEDFILGRKLQINKQIFQIIDADKFTLKYMYERNDIFKSCNINLIMNKIIKKGQNYPHINAFAIDFIKKIDKNKKEFINYEELYEGLKDWDITDNHQEIYTLLKYFDNEDEDIQKKENFGEISVKNLFNGIKNFINQN